MRIEVVELPANLRSDQVAGRSVVVFDVLRATTTIVTALAAGASEVRVFGSLDAAAAARAAFAGEALLCGERECLRPEGFDLGNSPGEYVPKRVVGKTLFLSTTNGTRAIVAARGAAHLFAAALVNASATANALRHWGDDVTLLCAGTGGELAPEDMIGAGAVVHALGFSPGNATAETAVQLFREAAPDLPAALQQTRGGQNILKAGLVPDIGQAARMNAYELPVIIHGDPPAARPMILA